MKREGINVFVALVIIPLLFLYFFFKTKREKKEQHQQWLSIGHVPESYTITGDINRIVYGKERFYYKKEINVYDLTIKTDKKIIKVIKKEPFLGDNIQQFSTGMRVRCLGEWNDDHFLANRIVEI